ncbi:hypothetical protein ACOMHN_027374 [Nucella lapillus]
MHPVLHAMTQHDRATTCDVREETKSRDYTEVANRRESPTTVRAGSTEELPRETRRPEEAVTSDITGETYGSGDQTAANGRGRFPPMAREDRVPVPHTTRKGKDSDDALRRECTSRAGRQTDREDLEDLLINQGAEKSDSPSAHRVPFTVHGAWLQSIGFQQKPDLFADHSVLFIGLK